MTKAETQSSEGGLTRALAREAGAWVLLALIWAPLLWRLARMWRSETEQMFGFGVPLLVAWLLWQRRGEWTQPAAPGRGAWWLAAAGAGLLGLALLALEANPLWPKAAWLGAGGALILTFAVIARGHGWRGVKASAPMWLLMLTALKWPAFIYEPVMRTMMQMNAVIAAELVNLFGTPAMVQGNVIEVAHGMVGVDEACSGLRSLQTVIMMALFLGELDRLRVRSRLALLFGAVLAALAVNVARTTVLTWVFANKGPAVEERWHDPAGVVALLVTLALVWLWSERLNQRGVSAVVQSPVNTESKGRPLVGLAWRPLAAAVFAVVTIEAGTQAWYLSHEQHVASRISWSLKTETDSGWVRVEVPRRSAEMLQYESSESFGRELRNPSRQMLAFAFRWEADMARMGTPEQHDPLVCLPTVGAVQEAELPEARVVVEGVEVPFRFIRFRQGALNQHVWFCLWGTRLGEADAERWQGGDISKKRWERVRAGLRNDEREQLIFFVQGEADDAGAEATLRDAVLTLLSRR
ncbi:MAG: exosortase/archaeosortase family protein [Rariglobus sp.]